MLLDVHVVSIIICRSSTLPQLDHCRKDKLTYRGVMSCSTLFKCRKDNFHVAFNNVLDEWSYDKWTFSFIHLMVLCQTSQHRGVRVLWKWFVYSSYRSFHVVVVLICNHNGLCLNKVMILLEEIVFKWTMACGDIGLVKGLFGQELM